ncbi:MAG: apolipoprotein N-acyltransferase [Lishizhenia sp.]
MDLSKTKRYSLSILSGVLLGLSFPFTGGVTPLIFVALIPLLFLEHYIYLKKYRPRKVFVHAYISFTIYNLISTWWIWNASAGGALMAFFLNGFLMAVFFQFFVWTKRYIGQKEGYVGLVIYWIAFEFFHYHWELSYPWLNFGNVFSTWPEIIQWYSYLGVLGGTLWVLLVNMIGFKVFSNVFFKKETWRIQTPIIWIFSLFIVLPASLSIWSYFTFEDKDNPAEIVAVQPNFEAYTEKFTVPVSNQIEKIISLAKEETTDSTLFVLAPETAIRNYNFSSINEDEFFYSSIYDALIDGTKEWGGAALYIGASTHRFFNEPNSSASKLGRNGRWYESYNSSLVIAENNNSGFTHKSALVLGVEKIPFSSWMPFLEELALSNGGTDGTLGVEKDGPKVITSKGLTFAPVVCYESIYGDFVARQCRKGAEAIFIITNDGWWKDTPGYKQHLAFAQLRAIENRRWVARSANTGSSAFINPRGEIIQKSDYNVAAVLKQKIQLNSDLSFYSTYGDWMGRSFGFVAVLMLVFTFVKYFRREKKF